MDRITELGRNTEIRKSLQYKYITSFNLLSKPQGSLKQGEMTKKWILESLKAISNVNQVAHKHSNEEKIILYDPKA